jgi:hypothetical protein
MFAYRVTRIGLEQSYCYKSVGTINAYVFCLLLYVKMTTHMITTKIKGYHACLRVTSNVSGESSGTSMY